jgi:hypothetical protein
MAKPYSQDLRERMMWAVLSGQSRHEVGCSFRTVSTRGGTDVRCQRELCDQAHAAG